MNTYKIRICSRSRNLIYYYKGDEMERPELKLARGFGTCAWEFILTYRVLSALCFCMRTLNYL